MNTLALLGVVSIALAASTIDSAAESIVASDDLLNESGEAETRLMATFDATKEHMGTPTQGKLVEGVDLSGTWRSPGGFDSTSLTFSLNEDGGYNVVFSTAGCLGGWQLSRTATYSGPIVQLNLPVEEYAPAQYTRLYTIYIGGKIHLLPSARVTDFDEQAKMESRFSDYYLLTKAKAVKETDT